MGELHISIQRLDQTILLNAFYKNKQIILITEWRCIIIDEEGLHDNYDASIHFEDLHTTREIEL